MYFKRLEMHGFKSFAEPVVIDFHEGVTCIVGPNGSGKSNISDAIRWVLGEQSPKMLRGGKMEEVIFAGTANRKSRGMAQVTLVIDNSTGILPIDYNEVAITRRMYRSGEGEYLINNNQCRLRDIRELIMDTGIGVDGYSLIGQGKIADIVSNKPESRREIFEEAAGVVMYKSKKAEAERKLSGAQANLERVNDIISEIEGRIDGLKEDSIKAKEFLELRDRYKELEINITLKNVEKYHISNEALKNDVEELAKSISGIYDEKKLLDKNVLDSRGKNENLEKLGTESREKLLEKADDLNKLTNKSQLDNERLSTINRDKERLSEEIKELNLKIERELTNSTELAKDQAEINEKKDKIELELADKIENYNRLVSQSLDVSNRVEAAKDKLFSTHRKISEKQSEVKSMESYKETIEKRKKQLLTDGDENARSGLSVQKEVREADEKRNQVYGNLTQLRTKLESALKEKADINDDLQRMSKEGEGLRIKASQLSARKKTIEEMESNYEGYNGAVRFIMKSSVNGIEGVVADIMKVPQGYEIAVETALGGALQNVVCQKDANAKEAVNLLKTNKAGRLTFLPLESVKGNGGGLSDNITEARGFKGLASEIVKYDSKFKGIFTYLLGRVVIVDNMDSAVALSKVASGFRVVTLEGEIVNSSGAITGGKYKNSTANLLARKSEINALTKAIEETNQKSDLCADNIKKLEKRRSILLSDIDDMEQEGKALEMKIYQLETKTKALNETIKLSMEAGQKRDRELESIQNEMERIDNMTKALVVEAEKLEAGITEIDGEIKKLTEKGENLKKQVETSSEEITGCRIEKNQWENKLQAAKSLIDRIKATVDEYQLQTDAKNSQLSSLETEKNRILFSNEDVEEIYEKAKKEKQDLEEYIEKITAEKIAVAASLKELEEKQGLLAEKINNLQDQKYQQEIKIAKNETQLDTMKEKLWEEFEISYVQAIELKKNDFVLSSAVKESRDIKNRLKDLGDVNVGSIKEYQQVSERYDFLTDQRSDIITARDELQSIIDDMDKTIKSKFKENFDQVVINFEKIFKELFGGGQAELRLDNEDNPLEAGIEIVAQPPGKKLQNINLMSGGEKTMTAIALMFAVLKTKPTPFCILDEVEAALDDSNIDRFAKYLRKFNNIQFTIVTHQKATMEHADVLYGVTMPEQGISKVLSLRLGDDFEL